MTTNSKTQEELSVKQRLAYCLLELMDTIPFDKISVSNIVERSGISRATFYRHFIDKNELLSWIYLNIVAYDAIMYDCTDTLRKKLIVYCQSFMDNIVYYKKAFSYMAQNSLFDTMIQRSDESTTERVKRQSNKDTLDETLTYAIKHYTRGNVRMLYEWIMAGTPGTAEHHADLMLAAVPVVLAPYLITSD